VLYPVRGFRLFGAVVCAWDGGLQMSWTCASPCWYGPARSDWTRYAPASPVPFDPATFIGPGTNGFPLLRGRNTLFVQSPFTMARAAVLMYTLNAMCDASQVCASRSDC